MSGDADILAYRCGIPELLNVVSHALRKVCVRKEIDLRRVQTKFLLNPCVKHYVGKPIESALGVVDHQHAVAAEHLGDEQHSKDIVGDVSAGVPEYVRRALIERKKLHWVRPRISSSENGDFGLSPHRQLALCKAPYILVVRLSEPGHRVL
jgi:hypothetical protein